MQHVRERTLNRSGLIDHHPTCIQIDLAYIITYAHTSYVPNLSITSKLHVLDLPLRSYYIIWSICATDFRSFIDIARIRELLIIT
jgi:hypothetical protein